jgi:hypothetical protein
MMTQPSVYFTLDAPFISIIGLYSNVLDGPGVISSQNNHFPIPDVQLDFLVSELQRLKQDRQNGKRAIALAVHHPPLSADASHGGSTGVSDDIDSCCKKAGLWPDIVLSGHAHLYQRFTRRISSGKQIPYLISGSGGFAITPPQTKLPPAPITVGDHTLEINPIIEFGYLTITVDSQEITVDFRSPTANGIKQLDTVTVNLASGLISSGAISKGTRLQVAKKSGNR